MSFVNEDQLRALVREAVARHLAQAPGHAAQTPAWKAHPSHLRFALTPVGDEDGPCIIEPAVTCHHCAFCQSLGH